MAGNVEQWVNDLYSCQHDQSSPSMKFARPNSGIYPVMRGGSSNYGDVDIRVAARDYAGPRFTANNIGFRCASSVP